MITYAEFPGIAFYVCKIFKNPICITAFCWKLVYYAYIIF